MSEFREYYIRNRNKKAIVLGLLTICYINGLIAQGLQFRHLTSADGLSHPYVQCIVQDNLGFMWFGTFDGLSKYDGNKFIVYRHIESDPYSLPANAIISLTKDPQGNLIIGTTAGLCIYDYDRDIFITYKEVGGVSLEDIYYPCILRDSKGNLWLGPSGWGLCLVDTVANKLVQYTHDKNDTTSISTNDIQCMFEDSRHNLWVGTSNSGVDVFRYNTRTFTHYRHQENNPESILGNSVKSITEDIQGNVWFACTGDGLSCTKVNQEEKHIFSNYKAYPKNPLGLTDGSIRILQANMNGGLWIGTQNTGIFFLPKDKKGFRHYFNEPTNPSSLNNNAIWSLYQDNSNDLWIGTYAGGVNIIHHTKQVFRHYMSTPGGPNNLTNNNIWKFAEDRNGTIWIATDGGGLNSFDILTENFNHYDSKNSNLTTDNILSVCVDTQNDLWIGTWAGGFSQYNDRTKSFRTYTHEHSGLSNNNVLDIADGRDGTLWLATQDGLNRFDKRTKHFTVYTTANSGLVHNQLEVVKVDSGGNVFIGTPSGMSMFDPKKNTWSTYRHSSKDKNSLSNNVVTSFFEENRKTLWIATSSGLNCLNRETQEMTHYSTTEGLLNNLIYGLEKDDSGYLWVSTNGGLTRFDPTTKSFKNFIKEDGLLDNVFIKKSHFKSKNGKLFFGGINGFNVIIPQEILINRTIPPVVLTDFQIFNKSVKPSVQNSPLKININKASELTLSYQQNVFSFEFSVLNYIAPTKNQYAYILEGFEKDWNYLAQRRTVTYTNIDPGQYIFRVKGSNDDGIWNEEGTAIKITIIPPFWQTTWFRMVMIIILLGIIATGHKLRTSRIHARNRELEQRISERTAQLESANKELEAFSYSVSHDLRAPLRSIDGFSAALLEDYSHRLDAKGKEYLRRVCAASEHMAQLIDDILDLSRVIRSEMKRMDVDLSSMVERILHDFKRAQPDRQVSFVIMPGIRCQADHNLINIVLENLLDNAWKFTSKHPSATIEFGHITDQNRTVYYVRDDGDGFDMAYAGKLFNAFQRMHTPSEFQGTGIGLTTVQRIIHRHGGRVWAEAEKGKGATFYFTLQ